jgi:hypothetical protein
MQVVVVQQFPDFRDRPDQDPSIRSSALVKVRCGVWRERMRILRPMVGWTHRAGEHVSHRSWRVSHMVRSQCDGQSHAYIRARVVAKNMRNICPT